MGILNQSTSIDFDGMVDSIAFHGMYLRSRFHLNNTEGFQTQTGKDPISCPCIIALGLQWSPVSSQTSD